LKTRRLDALPREEAVDCLAMHAQHASDAHRVETTVVNQAPNRFWVNAELRRNLADADETLRLSIYRRHNPPAALQVPPDAAWAGWTISPTVQA
jgi:hypothetical protein